ncbi:MAG: protein kinase [Thermoanaerobaculia bacterium]
MTLSAGTRLGPYEILSPLGAGGMGEVYRARDTKLDRDVAVKVLPALFADDPQALARFEREAKAVAALSHPNILAIFDFGRQSNVAYAVMELLEGETLRSRLSAGPLPLRKVLDYGVQILLGLAAAHDEGIVHRDLKPENVFVTEDGRIKILDFGLARQSLAGQAADDTRSPTVARSTEPGTVMGTVGYMSPEQVRGRPADSRSDIFSFGAVLYEMLRGRRAFQRDTGAETMTAILKEDPPELLDSGAKIPPGVDRIVQHCLEKSPQERFQSARDAAFDLQSLSGAIAVPEPKAQAAARPRAWIAAAGVALLALYSAAVYWAGHGSAPVGNPTFRQVTFRRGMVRGARFAPDGQTIVYGAAWEGKPIAAFSIRPGSPESSALDLPSADILAIATSGQLALQLGKRFIEPYVSSGTLAEAHLTAGEAPRERLQGVQWADWSPDGKRLAVVRDAGGRNRLESPVGTVLYQTAGWIGNPRFSPSGDAIAFLDHWARFGDLGSVVIVSLSGKAQKLSDGWVSSQGLAWWPDGREIWFTGTKSGGNRALHAVSRSGRLRLVFRQTGSLTLEDISPKEDVLLADEDLRVGIVSRAPGQSAERDLSWLDFSALRGVSSDGREILFDEASEGGGENGTIFVRKTDGSPPVRLAPGVGMGLSPDGRSVLASSPSDTSTLRLLPVGPGEPRLLATEKFAVIWANWFPDGKRVLVSGGETGHGARLYVQDVNGGSPRAVSPEGVHLIPYSNLISPDGTLIAAIGPDGTVSLFPAGGGEPRRIPGLAADEVPCGWDVSGRVLFVYRPGELPAHVYRLDVETGARQPWKELMPGDPTGVSFIRPPHFTRDGESYAYSYARTLSRLYLVKGLR